MVEKFARWVVRWRYVVIIANLMLVSFIATGVQHLTFSADYRVFFGADNPQLNAFEALQNTYTKNDNVLFVLAPKDGEVFTRDNLARVEQLTEAAWQIPYSIRVDSISNFQHTYADGDDLTVENLYEDASQLSQQDIERIRTIALNDPLLVNRLISPQAHVTGVNVTIEQPGIDQQREVPEVVAKVREMAQQVRDDNPDVDVYITGMTMMNNAFPEAAQGDMKSLVPLMFLVVIVLLGLLLRIISGTLAALLVIIFSIVSVMGLTGWVGISLTPPTSTSPSIIVLTVAVAHCVHVLVNFLHGMRSGLDKQAAMIESLRINLQPVFLTSLTTAIGFLSMNFSDAPPFRDLGNMVAMGVGMAFVYSVTLLPALMMVLPVRVKVERSRGTLVLDQFANFVVEQRGRLLWIMVAVVIIMVSFIPRNELNDEFVKYFDETIDFRKATDFTTENLTGLYTIEYSLAAGSSGGINDPLYLQKVEEFAQWYREQPEVMHVNTITDVMKRLNKNLHGDDSSWYRVPQARDLAAQYLLLYEMSLPYGLDLNNQINVDKSATRFSVALYSLSTKEVLGIEQRAQQWLNKNGLASMQVAGSSPTIMFANIGERNIRSMLMGTTLALVLISLVLIFALRSVKIGLVSMVPNLVPAAMAFGLWGMTVGRVGLALSVVVGMTLGIVVDDTVHFLSKYLRARREQGKNPEEAVRYAFSTVGMALWFTSLVLVAGFMVMTLSAFVLNADMGLLTAITIGLALLADFLLLPPLLIKIEQKLEDSRHAKSQLSKA